MNTNNTNGQPGAPKEMKANTSNVPAHRSALAHRCVLSFICIISIHSYIGIGGIT